MATKGSVKKAKSKALKLAKKFVLSDDAKSKLDDRKRGQPPTNIGSLDMDDPIQVGDFTFDLMQAEMRNKHQECAAAMGFKDKEAADALAQLRRVSLPLQQLALMIAMLALGYTEGTMAVVELFCDKAAVLSQVEEVERHTAKMIQNMYKRLQSNAVAAAAEAVSGQMKQLTGRNDAPDTSLWQQAFSNAPSEPGKPRLRWPGEAGAEISWM